MSDLFDRQNVLSGSVRFSRQTIAGCFATRILANWWPYDELYQERYEVEDEKIMICPPKQLQNNKQKTRWLTVAVVASITANSSPTGP